MKKPYCRPVSLKNARNGQRIRVAPTALIPPRGSKANRVVQLQPGAALVPLCQPMLILGCWFRQVGAQSCLTVYVNGTMPLALRTAAEAGRTEEETWLMAVTGGIREIDVTDCTEDFGLLLPAAHALAA